MLSESTLLDLNTCHCPYEDCAALVINECGGNVNKSKCPNCERLFCFRCKLPWHAGLGCEESREIRDPNDVAFGVLAEDNKWKRCPRCRHFVKRATGCSIIECRCRTHFCYRCGRQVDAHGCDCALEATYDEAVGAHDAADNGRLHYLCIFLIFFCGIAYMIWANIRAAHAYDI